MTRKVETKHERFKRLAESRTGKVLDMIDLLGNLSNKSFYEFSDKEVSEIFDSISEATEANRRKFKKGAQKKGRRFTL
jgi:hypothetical protein